MEPVILAIDVNIMDSVQSPILSFHASDLWTVQVPAEAYPQVIQLSVLPLIDGGQVGVVQHDLDDRDLHDVPRGPSNDG